MKEWKFTKPLISSYYIAGIFSFFLFQLIKPVIELNITPWLISFLSEFFGVRLSGRGSIWLMLFVVCFFITTIIRRIVVEPLELYVHKESSDMWEIWILSILVFGFYIFILNQVFTTPMPSDWWPEWVIRMLGGFENTYIQEGVRTVSERNAWVVVPWIWLFGPIFFLYVKTVVIKKEG